MWSVHIYNYDEAFFPACTANYYSMQAIINEDASGDVLSMRLQIQNLKVYMRLRFLIFTVYWKLFAKIFYCITISGYLFIMRLKTNMVLQKEVSRLQGLVGSDKTQGVGSHGFVCESPSTFKWDQGHGTFSSLIFDKRATQVFKTVLVSRT